jgi:hypothetical protein
MEIPSCTCASHDSAIAYEAMHGLEEIERLVDSSHFSVTVLKCPRCDSRILRVFCELIDWDEGDDSQAFAWLHVTELELEALRTRREEEQALHGFASDRMVLWLIWPRAQPKLIEWRPGPLVLLPHD